MRPAAYLTRRARRVRPLRWTRSASCARARAPPPGRSPRPRTGPPPARPAARPARGPGSMPSSAASSSPRSSGAGGPSRRQSSAAAIISRASVEVGLDHLRAGQRPGAAGGEAVGDGQQGDVDADRLGRPQVLVDAARRQRRLGDQEAEPQVVQGQPLQVPGEAAAGAQAGADPADRSRRRRTSWPRKPTKPSRSAAGRRLADVVEEGAEAQRRAAAHLVGQRLGQQRRRPRRRARRRSARGRASTSSVCSSTASVWPWTSRWWLGPCSTPRRPSSSGSTTAVSPSSSSRARPRSGSGPPSSWRSSASWRSPAGSAARARGGAGEGDGGRVDLEPELGGEAGGAQQPQRVLARSCARRPRAGARRSRSARPPKGSIGSPPGERHGDGADREVALGEVGLDALAAQRGHVDLPAAAIAATTRQVPNSAESSKACSPSPRGDRLRRPRRGRRRRRGRGRSTSRPSAASRTAPPTIQTPSRVAERLANRRDQRRRREPRGWRLCRS